MYIVGFVDYDGTQVFLTGLGHTEYPEEALAFDTSGEALDLIDDVERSSNLVVYLYKNGSIDPESEVL